MSDLSEAQRIERGRRASQALDDYLDPAFDAVHAGYIERMREIIGKEPWAIDKISALVMAQRVLEEVHKEIALLVRDGEAAKHDMIRVETIATMSAARRKALGI